MQPAPTIRFLSLALSVALVGYWSIGIDALADDDLAASDARIVHASSRLGFGPRQGEVERIRSLGLPSWIERQLSPERIPDPELRSRLAGLATLELSTSELMKHYDLPPDAKRELQKQQAKRTDDASMDGERERRQLRMQVAQKYPEIEGPPRQVLADLQQAKLLRAAFSERQLQEVMTDFWFNHFNVFADKGPEKLLLPEYEREVIRAHALGRFVDLLLASARSPAMLFYLDNWLSVDPGAKQRMEARRGRFGARAGAGRRPQSGGNGVPQQQPPRRTGLNENYARELLELHTLGVDGGYTQKDVTEVARCFTGWTIEGLRQQDPRFRFVEQLHDPGEKQVLGREIKGSGVGEGEQVLHLLAGHPRTARFVSYKLARRFVSDEPPAALVERLSRTFLETDGDIGRVLRTLFAAPEFWQAERAKVKTPFEFVVSAVRATGASVNDARDLARRVAEMGMPLYQQQPPTGYKDTALAWVSTSGLLARLNFSLDLAAGRVRGVHADLDSLWGGPAAGASPVGALAARLLPAGLSAETRRTLEKTVGAELDSPRVAGLILGSPEFQRR